MNSAAEVCGLVLAGGLSRRMGWDKGSLSYHTLGGRSVSQRVWCAELLREHCSDVFVSCRAEQMPLIEQDLKALVDVFHDAGPLGGLLSAFAERPNAAWFVLACDMPLVSHEHCRLLMAGRGERPAGAVATAFINSSGEEQSKGHFVEPLVELLVQPLVEPLMAVYEPQIAPILHAAYAQGQKSLRRILRSLASFDAFKALDSPDCATVHILHPDHAEWLANINTSDERVRYSL
jgi:molybdopterin-guanine dinucleotide biosynthesis protein A